MYIHMNHTKSSLFAIVQMFILYIFNLFYEITMYFVIVKRDDKRSSHKLQHILCKDKCSINRVRIFASMP
jgi:hypothetical protein